MRDKRLFSAALGRLVPLKVTTKAIRWLSALLYQLSWRVHMVLLGYIPWGLWTLGSPKVLEPGCRCDKKLWMALSSGGSRLRQRSRLQGHRRGRRARSIPHTHA